MPQSALRPGNDNRSRARARSVRSCGAHLSDLDDVIASPEGPGLRIVTAVSFAIRAPSSSKISTGLALELIGE